MTTTIDGTLGLTTPTYGGNVTAEYTVPVTAFKNRIINGAMTVAQRGTSGANGSYSLDRWIVAAAGTAGTWSQATGTFVNGQTGNFLQINGAAGNTFVLPAQRIESLNSRDLAGQTATVSYEIYQNTGSAMAVTTSLYYANSTDNFTSSTLIANSSVQSVATGTVTKVTATFSIPSAATTGIEVRPCSQLQALGAGQAIQIGNVQFEKGSTATSFDYRPYPTELALCQRYCVQFNGADSNGANRVGFGMAQSGTKAYANIQHPVPMRAKPAITLTATNFGLSNTSVGQTTTSVVTQAVTSDVNRTCVDCTVASGLTANSPYFFEMATGAATLILSAEL